MSTFAKLLAPPVCFSWSTLVRSMCISTVICSIQWACLPPPFQDLHPEFTLLSSLSSLYFFPWKLYTSVLQSLSLPSSIPGILTVRTVGCCCPFFAPVSTLFWQLLVSLSSFCFYFLAGSYWFSPLFVVLLKEGLHFTPFFRRAALELHQCAYLKLFCKAWLVSPSQLPNTQVKTLSTLEQENIAHSSF